MNSQQHQKLKTIFLLQLKELIQRLSTKQRQQFQLQALRVFHSSNDYLKNLKGQYIDLRISTAQQKDYLTNENTSVSTKKLQNSNISSQNKTKKIKKQHMNTIFTKYNQMISNLTDNLCRCYKYWFIVKYGSNWYCNFQSCGLKKVQDLSIHLQSYYALNKWKNTQSYVQIISKVQSELNLYLSYGTNYIIDKKTQQRWMHINQLYTASKA